MLEPQATMTIKEVVRQFIVSTFLFGCDNGFDDNASLYGTGVIDSTGMLELITFVEHTFHVKVADEELVPENFDTLENIAGFLEGRCRDARSCVSTGHDAGETQNLASLRMATGVEPQ